MKKISSLFLIGLAFVLFSCQSKEAQIEGNWEIYDSKFDCPGIDQEVINSAKELVKSYHYYFKEDGTLDYNDEIIRGAEGTWKVDGVYLKISYDFEDFDGPNTHEFSYEILDVDGEEMSLLDDLDGKGKATYYLRKL